MVLLHRLKAWLVPFLLLASLTAPGPALAQAPALLSWKDIDQLVSEQKLEAAAKAAEARLTQARTQGNEEEWTRALVRCTITRNIVTRNTGPEPTVTGVSDVSLEKVGNAWVITNVRNVQGK